MLFAYLDEMPGMLCTIVRPNLLAHEDGSAPADCNRDGFRTVIQSIPDVFLYDGERLPTGGSMMEQPLMFLSMASSPSSVKRRVRRSCSHPCDYGPGC